MFEKGGEKIQQTGQGVTLGTEWLKGNRCRFFKCARLLNSEAN